MIEIDGMLIEAEVTVNRTSVFVNLEFWCVDRQAAGDCAKKLSDWLTSMAQITGEPFETVRVTSDGETKHGKIN